MARPLSLANAALTCANSIVSTADSQRSSSMRAVCDVWLAPSLPTECTGAPQTRLTIVHSRRRNLACSRDLLQQCQQPGGGGQSRSEAQQGPQADNIRQ
jgi:hypothetical protein